MAGSSLPSLGGASAEWPWSLVAPACRACMGHVSPRLWSSHWPSLQGIHGACIVQTWSSMVPAFRECLGPASPGPRSTQLPQQLISICSASPPTDSTHSPRTWLVTQSAAYISPKSFQLMFFGKILKSQKSRQSQTLPFLGPLPTWFGNTGGGEGERKARELPHCLAEDSFH